MVKNPRETTKQLCKNLDIQFSEKIVAPTVLGEKTLGNSSFAKKKKTKEKFLNQL